MSQFVSIALLKSPLPQLRKPNFKNAAASSLFPGLGRVGVCVCWLGSLCFFVFCLFLSFCSCFAGSLFVLFAVCFCLSCRVSSSSCWSVLGERAGLRPACSCPLPLSSVACCCAVAAAVCPTSWSMAADQVTYGCVSWRAAVDGVMRQVCGGRLRRVQGCRCSRVPRVFSQLVRRGLKCFKS